jgi:hypothetical protein
MAIRFPFDEANGGSSKCGMTSPALRTRPRTRSVLSLCVALAFVAGPCASSGVAEQIDLGGGTAAPTEGTSGGPTGRAGGPGGSREVEAGAAAGGSRGGAGPNATDDATGTRGAAGVGGAPGANGGARDTGSRDEAGRSKVSTDPLRVLLIGNSFTSYNNLEIWLQDVAAGGTPKIQTRRLSTDGMTLRWHWENDARPAIRNGWAAGVPWTHVVLQGYSSEPLNTNGTPANALGDFQFYAGKLAYATKAVKATPVMLETWAYRSCFPELATMWGGTPDKMQDGLLAGYATAASANGAWLAKVGEGWRAVRTKHPEISLDQLYAADCKHPKEWGTYLAASVLYVRLTGHPIPAASKIPTGMSADVAHTLQAIALEIGQP